MTITPCKREGAKLDDLLKNAVAAQFALGKELLCLARSGVRAACGSFDRSASEPCCDMPEACWMPKTLGEIECRLSPGSSGQVRLNVTNNDFRPHQAVALSAGAAAAQVKFAPPQVALGPKERATIIATFTAPQQPGTYEAVLWVSVCSNHYLRWTVTVGDRGCPCCHEVDIDDNPDHVVHWYDHFYCVKPCLGTHPHQG